MDGSSHLAHRYAFGSNDAVFSVPGSPQHEFYIAMPFNIRRANELSSQIIQNQKRSLAQLRSMHTENLMALNEITAGLNGLASAIENGFSNLSDSLLYIEESLRTELVEIKWVLAQTNSKFAELLHLVKFPRETEAGELIGDGLKAMAAGNLDDAEPCFREALDKKRTSFQAHLNLGFVLLHKEDGTGAALHFKKAVDYAHEDDDVDIIAIENYARALFAIENFFGAREAMTRACELRRSRKKISNKSDYQMAVYLALTGAQEEAISAIIGLCRREPKYFAIAATDKDLESIGRALMNRLDQLAREEHERATLEFAMVAQKLAELVSKQKHRTEIAAELALIEAAQERVGELIERQNFRDSVVALKSCTQILDALKQLPNLTSAIRERNKLDEEVASIRPEVEKWSKLRNAEYETEQLRKKAFERETKGLIDTADSRGLGCTVGCLSFLIGTVLLFTWDQVRHAEYGLPDFLATIVWLASPLIGLAVWDRVARMLRNRAKRREYAPAESYDEMCETLQMHTSDLYEKQRRLRIVADKANWIRSLVAELRNVSPH